jgi:hypothetical protein
MAHASQAMRAVANAASHRVRAHRRFRSLRHAGALADRLATATIERVAKKGWPCAVIREEFRRSPTAWTLLCRAASIRLFRLLEFLIMRSLALAALPLFALSLVPACASSDTDDELLADSADDANLDGKADADNGAYTYFAISKDFRKCSAPLCGGFYLARVNRSTTVCHTGSSAAQCYTPVLDWSEAGLDTGLQQKLVDASGKTTGTFALVRGRFAKKNTTTPSPTLGKFIVTEAWIAEGENAPDGVFAKVFENGIRCIAAPCPTLTEKGLNTGNTANVADLDFAPADLSEHQIEGFVEQYIAPSGIIVAGDRYTFKINGRSGKGRTVTNAFHRLANAAAAE